MWFRHTDTKKERRMVGPSDLGSYRAVNPARDYIRIRPRSTKTHTDLIKYILHIAF